MVLLQHHASQEKVVAMPHSTTKVSATVTSEAAFRRTPISPTTVTPVVTITIATEVNATPEVASSIETVVSATPTVASLSIASVEEVRPKQTSPTEANPTVTAPVVAPTPVVPTEKFKERNQLFRHQSV